MIQIGNDWDAVLKEENGKEYFMKLQEFLAEERQTHMVYPPEKDVFNALKYSSLADTKVVIFGQDPYHEPGQAHGMCFSVNKGIAVPPSLINIYKEIETDLGIKPPSHGYLADWAGQGVLLLNTVLTVRAHQANSHRGIGWEQFTDAAIQVLNEQDRPMVFLLWGRPAQMKKSMLNNPKHLILEAPHPSPLSAYRGFFGSRPFSKVNKFLESVGEEPINWQLPNI